MNRRILLFCMAFLFAAYSICIVSAKENTNPYGAGLDGHEVPAAGSPVRLIDITKLSLKNPIDLLDLDTQDDAAGIIEALQQVKSGEALYLPEGIYNLKQVILLKSGKSLVGESRDGTVLKMLDGSAGAVVKGDNASDCLIEKMTLTSTWAGSYSASTSSNNPSAGELQFGALLYSSQRITIRQVKIEKFSIAGVALNASNDCRVSDTLLQNATDLGEGGHGYGILLQDKSGNKVGSYFNMIRQNTISGPFIRHGVLLQANAHHNLVEQNTFDGTRLDAIDLHGEGEHHNEISGNVISDGGESGIAAGNGPLGYHGASGPYNYLHDNEINRCIYGVTVMMGTPDTVIENNRINQPGKMGIRLWHSSNTRLFNNQFSGGPAGVWAEADGVDGVLPQGLKMEGNRFDSVSVAVALNGGAVKAGVIETVSDHIVSGGAAVCVRPELKGVRSRQVSLAGYQGDVMTGCQVVQAEAGRIELHLPAGQYDRVRYLVWEDGTQIPLEREELITE